MNERRTLILQQVERGEISTLQAARLLSLLEDGKLPDEPAPAASVQPSDPPAAPVEDPPASWKNWKWLPFGLAVLLTVVGSIWLYQGWEARQFGIGFWLAWFPFLLGVAGMALSWRLRWLHLRIRDTQKAGRPVNFTLHIPLPLGLAAWAVRTFGQFTPFNDPAQREELADLLDGGLPAGEPVQVWVDEDGTQVEIVID
ncbi:MAG TPA: hypothetical protein VFF68_07185 [Anaerolineaceae bacterium]|nr:hypothetical protein [Anaerolineaceae bacterium]